MPLRILVCALLAALAAPLQAADSEIQVLSVQTRDPALIARMGEKFGHLHVDTDKGQVTVEADAAQRTWLQAQGAVLRPEKVATELLQAQSSGRSLKSIPGFACYRTVEETQATVNALVAAHPELASQIDIGDTWDKVTAGGNPGYDLTVLKLTNNAIPGPKPKMFLMTAIHAREYTTAELNTRFAEWLVNNYGTDAEATWLLDNNEFHLLLQSNPDGRKQAETGLSWRKNVNTSYCGATSNSRGADLNRNYPFHWGAGGSSAAPCDETYRGPSAGSEPETQSVVNYVQSIFPDLRPDDTTTPAPDTTQGLFMDIHSFSQLVLWAWGDTTAVAPNGPGMEMIGRRMAWFNGYRPMQIIGLYPTTGTTADTAYGQLGVPGLSIELGTAFFENCASFEASTYPVNIAALRYGARILQAPYKLPFGPDTTQISATPDLVAIGENVRIEARVDDSRLNLTPQPQSGAPPVPATQTIASARAYVDSLPWSSGTAGEAMAASDGAFNSGSEAVQLDLSTGGLSNGRHLVYVQGVDSGSAAGAPNAVFVEVAPAAEIARLRGTVRDSQSAAPLAATLKIGSASVQSDAAGNYAKRLRGGSVDIQASAPGYMTERVSGLNLAGGSETVRDFSLSPNCSVFSDDVEGANPGWTAQSPWGVANNVAGNATKVWTDSPAGNYANNVNTSLTSPTLNLSGYEDAVLSFSHKCLTEAGYDFGIVEFSTNPGAATPSWSEIYRCSNLPSWQTQHIALPAGANNQPALKLRFRLTSDSGSAREGWSIDTIRLEAGGAACRASGDGIFADDFE
ncbi:carboxypeptidase family protein [Tahibacter aquaticus]|uniref:Carboxypeptidase family protein n=1 Tax=Tahibacter aquaticus TaxID=520092 RepID=A0A4R6YY50_9GAMM|nr:M14 family zinc carboxypeptidase [Tahibacter aquaticus]TDR43931.1 carboxypeptidase family protein [Tahibacter aquaticus]